ncbi:hypothetical protein OAH18_00445 [bacterium]|nr:hypothetical protein [bacterium]
MKKILLCASLATICFAPGCSLRSRYAMDDPIYSEKYADGAEKGDLLGKAKQALDARHTENLSGFYISGGAQQRHGDGHAIFGGEVGGESYAENWVTLRGSLACYIGEKAGNTEGYGGLDLGVRFQTPTRIAPFVGVGLFNGFSKGTEAARGDGIDNDDDGFIDERNERKSTVDGWMTAVYPEVGLHAWLNGNVRLTTFGRYFVTTEGRAQDDWMIGGQIAVFSR